MGSHLYNVTIELIAGKGGNGCVSFRRERRVAKGGPDGGDGGRGGSIYVVGESGTLTLSDFKYHRIWRAGNGRDGTSQNCSGRSGLDITINVPVGTQIWNEDKSSLLFDIVKSGIAYKIASGGRGGLGNQHFATSELQAPAIATKGEKGEHKVVSLVLKYMADIGVVGMPNAGKSTFVYRVSRANVKIGDYPFSTINPVLGVIEGKDLVIADLPGLIEGSHRNVGLGHQFLQHLDRCRILVHMVDSSDPDLMHNFSIIRDEIALYNQALLEKTYCICLTKADLVDSKLLSSLQERFESIGYKVLVMSEYDNESICNVVTSLIDMVKSQT